MITLCECNSITCNKTINLSIGKLTEIKTNVKSVIIVDSCLKGPEPNDILVSKESGYSVYKEQA